jgi:hypothetical protein
MSPGGGLGLIGANTFILIRASDDLGRESELQSGMNCTSAQSKSAKRREKDEEEKRSTTAASGGSARSIGGPWHLRHDEIAFAAGSSVI